MEVYKPENYSGAYLRKLSPQQLHKDTIPHHYLIKIFVDTPTLPKCVLSGMVYLITSWLAPKPVC